MAALKSYLEEYYKQQKDILLVYRPTKKHNWANRCFYLDDNYTSKTPYNHRTILHNEVVIEFDDEEPSRNEAATKKVIKLLEEHKIHYALWNSGNKSQHLHFLINTRNASRLELLKRTVLRFFTPGDCEISPDFRMAIDNHLIRAEYGVHEATGRCKTRLYQSRDYFVPNELPLAVWQRYSSLITVAIHRRATNALNELGTCDCVKYIATSHQFRDAGDGHERAMFFLIHHFKHSYSRDELVSFMVDWYRYSGGYKISNEEIARKVDYQLKRTYNFTERYIKELLDSIGKGDVYERCKIHGQLPKKDGSFC